MQPGNGRLSTHLHDLHLANHRIPIEALHEPQQSVRDGEDRILFSLRGLILADEKRRRFPACEPDGQLLHEVLQIEVAVLCPLGSLGHRSKGIDNHHAGARRFDFLNDAFQELLQRAVHHVLAQIDVADRLIHAGHIEEGELLLIAQHLEGGSPTTVKYSAGTAGTGEGEHDLLRERRFPRAWSAGNDIEGELRQAPTQDLVESRNACGKSANRNPVRHALCLLCARVGKGIGPRLSQQTRRQGFPDERDEQPRECGEHRSGGFSGDGRILSLQTENDLSKWPFRLLRLARVDQPRVFPLRKMQRATSQRIDANLANQRSRHPSEVIVGAARRSRESLRARGRPACCASTFSASCRSAAFPRAVMPRRDRTRRWTNL